MCMWCPPTVSRPYRHRHHRHGASCEQVVHKNAHAKKINKVLKTLDGVCNIIRRGEGIIILAILCWSVKRGGVLERLDNGYRTIWWYCVTTSPCRMRLYYEYHQYEKTGWPDDRFVKNNVQTDTAVSAWLILYTYIVLLCMSFGLFYVLVIFYYFVGDCSTVIISHSGHITTTLLTFTKKVADTKKYREKKKLKEKTYK